mmetsp:Transcript_149336/g.371882  ORF Transcript_149336/g.371882 Transcript_149336/m.371882 type:complete len:246 (-) Transcript_149336:256-993(-)
MHGRTPGAALVLPTRDSLPVDAISVLAARSDLGVGGRRRQGLPAQSQGRHQRTHRHLVGPDRNLLARFLAQVFYRASGLGCLCCWSLPRRLQAVCVVRAATFRGVGHSAERLGDLRVGPPCDGGQLDHVLCALVGRFADRFPAQGPAGPRRLQLVRDHVRRELPLQRRHDGLPRRLRLHVPALRRGVRGSIGSRFLPVGGVHEVVQLVDPRRSVHRLHHVAAAGLRLATGLHARVLEVPPLQGCV